MSIEVAIIDAQVEAAKQGVWDLYDAYLSVQDTMTLLVELGRRAVFTSTNAKHRGLRLAGPFGYITCHEDRYVQLPVLHAQKKASSPHLGYMVPVKLPMMTAMTGLMSGASIAAQLRPLGPVPSPAHDLAVTPPGAPQPRCECGGARALTTHSTWCPMYGQEAA